jgi:hypothetical protein
MIWSTIIVNQFPGSKLKKYGWKEVMSSKYPGVGTGWHIITIITTGG